MSKIIKILLVSLFLLASYNFVYSQKITPHFSIQKIGNKYFIGLEQIKGEYNKSLTYEWTIFFDTEEQKFITYKPLLYFESDQKPNSGRVRVYSNDLSFDENYNFVFNERAVPIVSIVRYLDDLNVVLPLGKIEKNEKLFPLVFNFSSNNLSIAWRVLGKFYYSLLFDPEGLDPNTEIRVIVTNIDKKDEFSSDIIKLEK